MATIITDHGFSFVVSQRNNGIEGSFGFGFVLGTNLLLDVQTIIGTAVLRHTPYSLSYTDPADGALKTIDIRHDPDWPYSPPRKLPEKTIITLIVPESPVYQALTTTIIVASNASPVLRARLLFKQAHAYVTIRQYH